MRQYKLLIFLFSIVKLVQGQNFNQTDSNGLRQGLWKFYENDSVRMICPFKNDLSTGIIQYFEHDRLVMKLEGDSKDKRKWYLFQKTDTLTGYYVREKKEITDTIGRPVDKKLQDRIVGIYEVYPSFVGGTDAMLKYIQAFSNKINERGKVKVQFTVGQKGEIKNATIKESSNVKLNDIAIKLVSDMPAWQPGCDKGRIIEVSMLLPLNF
jgi:hypothetical protein